MRELLEKLLGPDAVLSAAEDLASYRGDFTEAEPSDPSLVAYVTTPEQIQEILPRAAEQGVPVTPVVAGTNVGGLAIPAEGGLVLDLSRMDRVVEVDEDAMVVVLEPGVTQRALRDYLVEHEIPLTTGFSLGPTYSSVAVNALMGGLTNRSLKYGDQSEWISGLEVVLADGTLLRTGAWALSDVPFGRIPFPDLSGLFVGWQATTGIVTKVAFQLWPLHPISKRLFVLSYDVKGTYAAVMRLCRLEVCDDIGGLSWPSAKMMLGVEKPSPTPVEGEPIFFLYVDLTAESPEELSYKERTVQSVLDEVRASGARFDDPLDVSDLVAVDPALASFADLPTDLRFLTDHSGGGLTWIGTYGPLARFGETAEAGIEIMVRHGVPPLIVSRPMRGGHFGVLRLITTFDKKDPEDVERARRVNLDLLRMMTERGFIMYKTPAWAWRELAPRMDPGMLELMAKVKGLLDPKGVLNPGKLGL